MATTSMPATIVTAAITAVIVASATCFVLVPGAPPAPPTQGGHEVAPRSEDRRAGDPELEQTLAEMRALLEAREERRAIPTDGVGITDADLERAVERVLARREHESPPADVARVMADLLNPSLDPAAKDELWRQLRESGQIDAVVAQFEALAAAAPADSRAQTELAWAYQHRMLASVDGPERGKWGGKAAETFTRALELDATNWDARYSLAQHSYWADMRGDAIRHFEILLQQQERRAPEAKHAQAYLWLGNIHMDRGDKAEAERVWREGIARFPADAALRERLESFR